MKRKLNCPILYGNVSKEDREYYLKMLKEAGATRLFIAPGRNCIFKREIEKVFAELKEHVQYFQENGLEVGVWINSFGFGNPLSKEEAEFAQGLTKIRSVLGRELGDALCPEDPKYTEMFCEQMRKIAKVNPDLIMLDDDLCLSVRPGIGCFCDRHMELLEEKVGHKLQRDTMLQDLFEGGKNELRDAWLSVMTETLRKFCFAVRAAVDEVDAKIRVGFCAGYTSWDIEGATAIELTRILAGNTKPFLRFTGAPYWVSKMSNRFPGQRLHNIIEFAREQAVWCRGEGIEFFNEADSYPRARYQVPANLLECFDAATVASDDMDSLKYLFDYFSSTEYEKGYLKLHKKNAGLYDFLETHFTEKHAVGVQVYERMQKIADMDLPRGWDQKQIMMTSLPVAAAILTSLTIPVTYDENVECAIAFNVNVDDVKQLPKRMILDIVAAKRLQEQGVDVGLCHAESIEQKINPPVERFGKERISLAASGGRYFRCQVKEDAIVESVFELDGEEILASYTYDNGTTKFLVYTFDAYSIPQSGTVFCSYGRQEQLLDFYSDFPVLRKSPYVYQLCKRGEGETVAFFANIFEDEMFDFEIELDKEYKTVECYGIEAALEGNMLKVHSEVAAYGMFAIRLCE